MAKSNIPVVNRFASGLMFMIVCQAQAQSVDIQWTGIDRFTRSVKVLPSQPYEFCKTLSTGQKLLWSFESSQPLSFTVYQVDGSKKTPRAAAANGWKSSGKVDDSSTNRICWSWTNSTTKPVELAFDVRVDR
ncbi:hypothetical protein [Roseateles sp. P5_E8]